MPLFLSSRDTSSTEQMDSPDCDLAELENTYRQFSTINTIISQWRRVYKQEIRPHAGSNKRVSLLDIGFGGGDIPLKLASWAAKDGLDLQVTAIDTDKRAVNYIKRQKTPDTVKFLHASSSDLVEDQRQFDFVISNHLLHHLSATELENILQEAKALSRQAVFFNDIRRSDIAYLFFNLFSRPVFQSSFITQDGLTSISRSYTQSELVRAVPDGWEVRRLFPFRLLLTYYHKS